jgi:hypothetical protein
MHKVIRFANPPAAGARTTESKTRRRIDWGCWTWTRSAARRHSGREGGIYLFHSPMVTHTDSHSLVPNSQSWEPREASAGPSNHPFRRDTPQRRRRKRTWLCVQCTRSARPYPDAKPCPHVVPGVLHAKPCVTC